MSNIQDTVRKIAEANGWDQRIAQIRLIPLHHGTNEHPSIYAEIARLLYVPHLAADFAYIHENHFYGRDYFEQVYADAYGATAGFTEVTEDRLTSVLWITPEPSWYSVRSRPLRRKSSLMPQLWLGSRSASAPVTDKVDGMERNGTATTNEQAKVAAKTLSLIIDGSLFGVPPATLSVSKQNQIPKKVGRVYAYSLPVVCHFTIPASTSLWRCIPADIGCHLHQAGRSDRGCS